MISHNLIFEKSVNSTVWGCVEQEKQDIKTVVVKERKVKKDY